MSQVALVLTLLLSLILVVWPARATEDLLARHRWRSRVLVVLADEGHPALAEQRRIAVFNRAGFAERDLVVVEAVGGHAGARRLREQLGVGPAGFRAVLVGKDGGPKLTAEEPLSAERLFAAIDAMPMRQDEMRRGR